MTETDIIATYELLKHYRGLKESDSLFQYNYVCDLNSNILLNYVGRFENLNKEFQKIMKILNLKEELPFINSSTHEYYTSYYNDNTRKLVEDLYQIDILKFGYTFLNK